MAPEGKNEDRKQRIRDAFNDGQKVERMPPREDMAPQHSEDVTYRVAPYCRVSTMSEMQAESFEIQQQYYNEYIAKHPNWSLVRIYADATVIIGLMLWVGKMNMCKAQAEEIVKLELIYD